jgi:flagellar hook protein FlgE
MILAERGFQATGRIITQTDRMVMELMRLRM